MATNPPAASTLPWIWTIEALASFKQVDASILIDLVKMTPEISDDLGKNAREMVSFRILESLFVKGIEATNNVASVPGSKICFDPSDRCEDVLRRILNESSGSKLRMAESETLKWDVQPFIMHKRSRLPKCALHQLKDKILQGSHPLFSSLKERSGLVITNESGNIISANGIDCNGVTQRREGSSTDAPTNAEKGNLFSQTPENGGNGKFQENLADRNLLPAKRVRNGSDVDDRWGQSHRSQVSVENGFDLLLNAAKKLKQDAMCTTQAVGQNLVSLPGTELVEDSSGRIVQNAGREGCHLSKEPQLGGLEESRSAKDVCDEYAASGRLAQSCHVDDGNNQQQVQCNDDKVPQDTSGQGQGQGKNICVDEAKEDSEGCVELRTLNGTTQGVTRPKNSVDEAKENCEHVFQSNASNCATSGEAKDDMEHNHEYEMPSDSDGYNDERTDIATKKHVFLSSQCTYSQDSLATTDWTELNLCMKCNKGGQLLVCSSDVCPLVVHESCLGSAATFDVSGNFYCPFCAYSRAISEYLDVKKKVSLAKKDLTTFIGLGIGYRPKKFSKRLHRLEKNQPRQDEDLDKSNETNNNGNFVDRVNNSQCRENTEDMQQTKPPESCTNDYPPCGEKGAAIIDGTHCVFQEDKLEGQKIDQDCQSPRGLEDGHIPVQAVHDCEEENSSRRDTEIVNGSGVLHQPVIDFPHKPVCPPSTDDIEGSSEEENDKSNASNYSIRFRKRERQYTYPAIPQLRRKTLKWVKIEEDTLKEGVQRFSNGNERSIPWKKILEFGSDVFLKGRTTIDLKDKWRNICKGSPKSK